MSNLSLTDSSNFHYLLELMRPLHRIDEFAMLPELFTLLGHERLITLCKYAGGETVKIPTLAQLSDSIDALDWFYNIRINHTKTIDQAPQALLPLIHKISEVYDARAD